MSNKDKQNKPAKKVLITGGPTDEFIDEVMKITNMSTGSLAMGLAEKFDSQGWEVCLIINEKINVSALPESVRIVKVLSADDMSYALEQEGDFEPDVIFHVAAVGDYKAGFTFLMDDMAEEIFEHLDEINGPQEIYDILTNPECRLDNNTKISSYQPDLTIRLDLTPKIISKLRGWFPDSLIIGAKLLENVSKDELYAAAQRICKKNQVDFVMSNDLAELRQGDKTRHLVNQDGYTGLELKDIDDIYEFVAKEVK